MQTLLSHLAAKLRPLVKLGILCAALSVVPNAWAAAVTWGAATTIAGDSDVSTIGTFKYAYHWISPVVPANPVVNGVTFTGSSSISAGGSDVGLSGYNGYNTGYSWAGTVAPFTNLSSNYQAMLAGTPYTNAAGPATITLKNLTVGNQYAVQIWLNDSRVPGYGQGRGATLTSGGGNTVTLDYNSTDTTTANGGVGQFSLGVFIADASSQTFTVTGLAGTGNGGGASAQLNALQLRDLGLPGVTTMPTFSLPTGTTYIGAQSVTLTSSPGATIYYTTDGSTPTNTSASGISPVSVTVPAGATTTLLAYGHVDGNTDSAVSSATYTTLAATPAAGTWTNPAGDSWITASNWSGGTMAYGSDSSADFSTLSLTSDATVTLDALPLSIGSLHFDDQSETKYAWTLDTGSGGPLTLAVSSGSPVINNNVPTTIGTTLAGTQGLTKTGDATLTFAGNNTYTGNTVLNAGTLAIGSAANLPAASDLTLSGGAALSMTAGMTLANNVTIASGQSGTLKNMGTGVQVDQILTGNYSGVVGTLNLDPSTSTASYPIFFIYSNNGPAVGAVVKVLNHPSYTRVDLTNSAYQSFFTNTKLHYDPAINNAYAFNMGNGSYGMNVQIGALDGGGPTTKITSDNRSSTLTITGTASGDWGGVIANGAGSGPQITLVKTGGGTQVLTGANTYSGTTTVNGGTLQIGNGGTTGSLATGSNIIINNGTLAFNRSDSISQGTHFSGNAITGTGGLKQMGPGNLTITASNTYTGTTSVVGGGLVVGVPSGTTWDVAQLDLAAGTTLTLNNFAGVTAGPAVNVTGSLTAHGTGTVTIHVPGTLAVGTYPLIYYPMDSQIGGDGFAALALGALPSGVTGHLVNNLEGFSVDLEITAVVTDPFANWISTQYPSLTGDAALPGADPDGDGLNNLAEFAFKGDPTSGSRRGLTTVSTIDTNGNTSKELTLTIATRSGANFNATAAPVATVDGLTYTAQGSLDLTDSFAAPVTELIPALTPALTGLPDIAGSGWEYHTFILNGSEGLSGKGFLRAKVSQ